MQILSSSPLKLRITFVTMVIVTVACLVMLATGAKVAAAQDSSDSQKTPYLDDWTHHHLVFSDPGTKEEAARRGKLEQWNKVNDEFRFHLQQGKRTYGIRPVGADRDGDRRHDRDRDAWGRDGDHHHDGGGNPPAGSGNGIVKDWNTPLGSGGAAKLTGAIGTLNTGTISGSSQLTVDGVTFSASAPATSTGTVTVSAPYCFATGQGVTVNGVSLTTAATASKGTITIGTDPATNNTITVGAGGTNPGNTTYILAWYLQCGNSNCITHTGNTTQDATNLANALGGTCGGTGTCTADPYVTATASTNTVVITAKCVGASALTEANTSTNVTFSAVPVGSNGTTIGSNFCNWRGKHEHSYLEHCVSAITAQTATDFCCYGGGGGERNYPHWQQSRHNR